MHRPLSAQRRYLISSSAVLLTFLACATPALAFNPDDGALTTTRTAKRLPDPMLVSQAGQTPLYAPGTITPSAPGYISPLSPVAMPAAPLYPTRTGAVPVQAYAPQPVVAVVPVSSPMAAPAATMSAVPHLPPVDPAVAARAQAILAAENAAVPVAASMPMAQPVAAASATGFVAPAPVFAVAPVAEPAPVAVATPVYTPPAVAAAPVPAAPAVAAAPIYYAPAPMAQAALPPSMVNAPTAELSDETRTILSRVPAALDTPKKVKSTAVITMDRVDPEIKALLGEKAQEESYEAVGLSIKVRRPGLDTNYELNRAYTSLMGGDTQTAIETYKNILGVEPRNEDALFGLAATYHRLGNVNSARPLYGMLLKVNPNHREGLNNFLVLVSDESPQDALPELERLEERNPDFSPIPAQIAIVLDKMGYADASREKMLRAIELAPDNMTYKYNFAVMLDHRGEYANAAALYRQLIQASLSGAAVPSSLESMQKRLTYIVTEMNMARTAGR